MPSQTPTPDDVVAAVLARLKAEPGFAQMFPAGVWLDRRPGSRATGQTYAVITCEEGRIENRDSGGGYTQRFVVEVTAWVSGTDTQPPDTASVRRFLDVLGGGAGNPNAGVQVTNAVKTITCLTVGGRLKLNDDLRRGRDVFLSGKRVEIMVEGRTGG